MYYLRYVYVAVTSNSTVVVATKMSLDQIIANRKSHSANHVARSNARLHSHTFIITVRRANTPAGIPQR